MYLLSTVLIWISDRCFSLTLVVWWGIISFGEGLEWNLKSINHWSLRYFPLNPESIIKLEPTIQADGLLLGSGSLKHEIFWIECF